MRFRIFSFLVLFPISIFAAQNYSQQWNFATAGLADDKGTEEFIALLKKSKAAGCTHILFNDSRWIRFSDDPAYLARVQKVKTAAKELDLTLVPTVFALGYSGRYLCMDHNMAAGLPVKNMPFIAHKSPKDNGGSIKRTSISQQAAASPDPAARLDISSLKDFKGALKVKPFMHYRVTFELDHPRKEDELEELVWITSLDGKRVLSRNYPTIKEEGRRYSVVTTFNSLESEEVKFNLNARDAHHLKIDSAGTLMIIRRNMVPITVTSEDGKTTYVEGEDYEPITDPVMKDPSVEMTMDHESAPILLTDNSKIENGQRILVSFWHAYRLGTDQDIISLDDPETFKTIELDVANCAKVWGTKDYFINYDEIRIAGWEPQPDGRKLTPGQLLAEHVTKGCELVRKYSPDAKIYTWSDMFTPFHNARPFSVKGYYYLVNGNWDGSWEGLPKDVVILNWYSPQPEGVKFFAERGNAQVICGFYDSKSTAAMKNNIANWMKVIEGAPNILGWMYTTWHKNFDQMEEYFTLLKTYDQWGAKVASEKEKEPGVTE